MGTDIDEKRKILQGVLHDGLDAFMKEMNRVHTDYCYKAPEMHLGLMPMWLGSVEESLSKVQKVIKNVNEKAAALRIEGERAG